MPTYCYECKCGRVSERTFTTHADRSQTVKCACGARAKYSIAATASGGETGRGVGDAWRLTGGYAGHGGHEMGSLACAIFSDQVIDQKKHDRAAGVDHLVTWERDNRHPDHVVRPCWESNTARRKWLKANGKCDYDSYV